jgi:glycosyltransferase involved in cell wall biosynthesis
MRLAALELAAEAHAAGAWDDPVDVIFATSLMSLADLRAVLPPPQRRVPAALYLHENQAAYPEGHADETSRTRDAHFALTNLTSIAAADLAVWNSDWNRRSFARGIADLLAHAPDGSAPALAAAARRETVIWPPVEPPPAVTDDSRVLHNPPRVCWPHRWEHDKGPDELLAVADAAGEEVRWTILGEQFRTEPPALAEFRRRHADRIDHVGFEPDRDAYLAHLARCDWVLSTARHEFFGIAVVEAMLAGCLPWLPDRLSYPELLPPEARGLAPDRPPADPAAVRRALRRHLEPALAPNAVARIDDALEELAKVPA